MQYLLRLEPPPSPIKLYHLSSLMFIPSHHSYVTSYQVWTSPFKLTVAIGCSVHQYWYLAHGYIIVCYITLMLIQIVEAEENVKD